MRKLIRHLSPPELRVLVYLQTRCSQFFICYPTLEEIAHDLGLGGRRNLTPYLKALEKKNFIATATGAGKKYFLDMIPAWPSTTWSRPARSTKTAYSKSTSCCGI